MTPSPQTIANKFILLSKLENINISIRKLHILIYIANGISYAVLDKPIQYRQIYAKECGVYISKGISNEYTNISEDETLCDDACDIINAVWRKHRLDSIVKLTYHTCKKGTPFHDTLEYYGDSIVENMVISEIWMQNYYIEVTRKGEYVI